MSDGYVDPYGKDRVFLYDDLDEFRDAAKEYAENTDDPEQTTYAYGFMDAIGFLMVNHPKTFTQEDQAVARGTAAQMSEILKWVLERREERE